MTVKASTSVCTTHDGQIQQPCNWHQKTVARLLAATPAHRMLTGHNACSKAPKPSRMAPRRAWLIDQHLDAAGACKNHKHDHTSDHDVGLSNVRVLHWQSCAPISGGIAALEEHAGHMGKSPRQPAASSTKPCTSI